ncbi:hypothetical protein [Pseudomonas putida]|uniref:Uncharacterized protein n=1 Tax=Pseudomonas putida TaxID=303 RepID=A0A8I1ECC6_PSEPU|nr:hypothetical protein [Pseudomonas putida]MBI6883066.1 hypothetical protein [Pseudomonas putida]
MSNKKSQGELRRELIMLKLRHSIRGIKVNCSGGLGLDDDLRRLIKEGRVKLTREPRLHRNSHARYHIATPADGVFLKTWPACPCCGKVSYAVWAIEHALNCSLRTDHRGDFRRNPRARDGVSLEPRQAQNRK